MAELSEDFMYVLYCEGTAKIIVKGSNGLSRFYVARVSEDNNYTISVLNKNNQTDITNFFTFNLVESYYNNTYGNSIDRIDNLYVDVYEINVSQDLVDCTYLEIRCTSSANNVYRLAYNVTDSLTNSSAQVLYNKEGFYGGTDYIEYGKPITIETEYLKSTTIYEPEVYVNHILRDENYVTVTKLSENDNKIKYQFNFSDTFTPYQPISIEFSERGEVRPAYYDTVTSTYNAILTYYTPKPKIYTELLSATSIPSYGGTVKVKVLYEDYQSIITPIVLFNGDRQTTNYMNDDSTMSNDLYNYVFDFPKAEEDRTITIRFLVMGEGGEVVYSDIQITQKGTGGTGGGGNDDDNDEPPLIFDDVLTLSSYGDEYNYEESEDTYTLQAIVKTAIDEEIGSLGVVIDSNVNWVRFDIQGSQDINHHYYKETVFNYTINIAENTNEVSRLTVVTFNYYNTDNELIDSKEYVLVQDAEKQLNDIEYYSCWEDIIFTIDEDIFNYSVVMSTFVENDKSEEVTIFNGRAYKYPNADNIEIKLNKIFENYLTNSLTNTISKLDLNTTIDYNNRNYESCKRFIIINRDTNEYIKEYRVLYDWSYKYKWRGEEKVLSKPIENKYGFRQLYFNTTVSKLGIVTNYITNTINNNCGDYALYYLNSFGGWDSLLLNNKVNKSKSINSYTTEKYIRNLNVDFEQYRYISELQNSYDVTTNLLTDEQATNTVDNLFTSNEVYLHNLTTDIINAVLVTNNKVNYKKYSDNLELPYFTINIKESQIQLKR